MNLRTIGYLALFTLALGGTHAFAAGPTDFIPIVPLPDLPSNGSVTLPEYLNEIFRIAIILGGVLAVLMIMYGGYQYMTSEAIGKKDGKDKIQSALLGLALLLFSYLILNVINPTILNLDVLGPTPPAQGQNQASNFPSALPTTICPNNKCNGLTFQIYNETTLNGIQNGKDACIRGGGTPRDACLDNNLNSHSFARGGTCGNGNLKASVCIPGK